MADTPDQTTETELAEKQAAASVQEDTTPDTTEAESESPSEAPQVQPQASAENAEADEETSEPVVDRVLLRKIIEGALLAAGQPLTVAKLADLFVSDTGAEPMPKDEIKGALEEIQADCEGRGFELKEVGSGWRFQVRAETATWVNRLWDEKPQKYSRALLETLALIAYRQPITRGDIEEIRGVAVSSHIIKTLSEREWIKVVGHRDVPGRPSLYATTRQFLDYFNLNSLDELPSLSELRDLDELNKELDLAEDPEAQEREGIDEAKGEVADTPDEHNTEHADADADIVAEDESFTDADLLAAEDNSAAAVGEEREASTEPTEEDPSAV